jgi:hypothetical protein
LTPRREIAELLIVVSVLAPEKASSQSIRIGKSEKMKFGQPQFFIN